MERNNKRWVRTKGEKEGCGKNRVEEERGRWEVVSRCRGRGFMIEGIIDSDDKDTNYVWTATATTIALMIMRIIIITMLMTGLMKVLT